MENHRIRRYDTDVLMRNLWLHLVRDFRAIHGRQYCADAEKAFVLHGIAGLRSHTWPERFQAPPWLFKTEYQLENLFKRYRFQNDVFTDTELEQQALKKFAATQERVGKPLDISPVTFSVLQEARKICKKILGQYDPEEHMDLCRFGKRASVGSPYARSYLDCKLSGPITGSQDHLRWFREEYLPSDTILEGVLSKCSPTGEPNWQRCETLALTNVPKSWKSLRSIMPNTLIGGFYSYGLGKVIEQRLRDGGLDIKHLQVQHGRMARDYSRSRSHVTADLSAASDSITYELIARVLPRPWLNKLKFGRIGYCRLGDKSYYLSSFMTMGIGFTFPLEMLIFYALLQAMKNLLKLHGGRISVYGDDLIYPRALHSLVSLVFPKLHLNINKDKTYVTTNFRESCGSDYFHGIDVRPFNPEGGHQALSKVQYHAYLYKITNGLRRRWLEEEIPQTLNYLYTEILCCGGLIHQVPPSFPDESGIKVISPMSTWYLNWSPVTWAKTSQTYVFRYLRKMADARVVENLHPFYWEKMRSSRNVDDPPLYVTKPLLPPLEELSPGYTRFFAQYRKPVRQLVRNIGLEAWENLSGIIRWTGIHPQPKNYRPLSGRTDLSGKRLKAKVPCVASRVENKVVSQTGSTSLWV